MSALDVVLASPVPPGATEYNVVSWASILTIPFVTQGVSLQIASVLSSLAHAISFFIALHSCILKVRHAYFFIAAGGSDRFVQQRVLELLAASPTRAV